MTKMVAPEAMLRRFRKMRRQEGIQAFLQAASKPRTIQQRLTNRPVKTEPQVRLSDPTPERAEKAVEVQRTAVPPFNSRVLGAAQKFYKHLGPETMMVLERLYEVGSKGETSRGLTAGYDGVKVDSSRISYEHLSVSQREAHEIFRAAMATMPPELQRYAREIIMEDGRDKPRTMADVGSEISGYEDHRRAIGATVATMKIIAWCVQKELGVRRRKK